MIETLSVTQILAGFLGLYMVAAGTGMLTDRNSYATMIEELRENTALGFLTGAFLFALGAAMVAVHNLWTGPLAVVVSLLAWWTLIKGVLLLAIRRPFLDLVNVAPFTGATGVPLGITVLRGTPMQLVRQQPGSPDCIIVCIANALGLTYQESEDLLGIKCDDLPPEGVDVRLAIHRLLPRGWAAVVLIAGDGSDPLWPTEADIKAQLPGRKAIIGYRDAEAGDHSLYWDGEILHDCSTPAPSRPPNLAELKLDNALVLFPVPVVD